MLSERANSPPGADRLPKLAPDATTPSGRIRTNDRAIELSQKRPVELVLYARGLEIERERLLRVIGDAHDGLAGLRQDSEMPPDLRDAVDRVIEMLAKCL